MATKVYDFLERVDMRNIFDELLLTGRVVVPDEGLFIDGLSFRDLDGLRDAMWQGVKADVAKTKILAYLYSAGCVCLFSGFRLTVLAVF